MRPIAASLKTASEMSGLSKTVLYELLAGGRIEGRKVGRSTLIIVDSLERYIMSSPAPNLARARQQAERNP